MPEIDFSRPVLAIDSGTSVLSLALRRGGKTFTVCEDLGSRQSERLLPALHGLLDEAGVVVSDLGVIVYNQGPGMFTGLRIGIGVAQGLAAPFGIPLIAIPSLDAAASLIPDCPKVLAAIDARMGEVFYAWFDTSRYRRLSAYCVGKARDIEISSEMDAFCGIGNAFLTQDIGGQVGSSQMPQAEDFLDLALQAAYPAASAAEASLLYVRNKVALTAAEQAVAKARR